MNRVLVEPALLRWARERATLKLEALSVRFPKLSAWERGDVRPTLKQLESFAKVTCVPLGYLFLREPPEERLPIPDFRTVSGIERRRPSPDLLETIYTMQRRQAWLRETLVDAEAEPLPFVGAARTGDAPEAVGREMRRMVGLGDGWASQVGTWQGAVLKLREAIEDLGIIAVINGVVGNNTHRKLDVHEFRGLVLCDTHAPLILVNGADAKSAQMFTLAHELAHVWLGREGVSGFENPSDWWLGVESVAPHGELVSDKSDVEEFCDKAGAEFLVPARELRACWNEASRSVAPFEFVAKQFRVSPIVAGRRAMDLNLVERETFFDFYHAYVAQERRQKSAAGGGDFYNNQNTRVGAYFATHVIRAALEGRVSFREAYDLTGLRGGAFQEYAHRLGFDL